MSRLGVLVNPAAGGGRGARVGAEAVDLLRRRGHDVVPVTAPAPALVGAPGAPAVATTDPFAARTRLDALVVVGGDGTVHAGAQLTAGTDLPLGIVAAGTGNDVAATLGLARRDLDAALAGLERALDRGPRRVDAVAAGSPGEPAAIAPHATPDDGVLDVVVAGPVSRRELLTVLPGAYRGRHLRHPAVRVLRTRTVLVEAAAWLGGPVPAAYADGEPLGALPQHVHVHPGALAVLA